MYFGEVARSKLFRKNWFVTIWCRNENTFDRANSCTKTEQNVVRQLWKFQHYNNEFMMSRKQNSFRTAFLLELIKLKNVDALINTELIDVSWRVFFCWITSTVSLWTQLTPGFLRSNPHSYFFVSWQVNKTLLIINVFSPRRPKQEWQKLIRLKLLNI